MSRLSSRPKTTWFSRAYFSTRIMRLQVLGVSGLLKSWLDQLSLIKTLWVFRRATMYWGFLDICLGSPRGVGGEYRRSVSSLNDSQVSPVQSSQ